MYYPDVGLTPQSIVLTNLRLAPVQVASLGHSVSTWGAEVNYMVSGAEVEPADDPAPNYSERSWSSSRAFGTVHKAARTYVPGLQRVRTGRVIINCPWVAQKVDHRSASAAGTGPRVGSGRPPPPLRRGVAGPPRATSCRSSAPFGGSWGRPPVEVVRPLPYRDYMALMEAGDFTLDSFPFGGCNVVADSLHLRKLTVCREGDLWYNRIGPAMLRRVGLEGLVASTGEEYVSIALRLIHDDAFREPLQAHLDRADLQRADGVRPLGRRLLPPGVRLPPREPRPPPRRTRPHPDAGSLAEIVKRRHDPDAGPKAGLRGWDAPGLFSDRRAYPFLAAFFFGDAAGLAAGGVASTFAAAGAAALVFAAFGFGAAALGAAVFLAFAAAGAGAGAAFFTAAFGAAAFAGLGWPSPPPSASPRPGSGAGLAAGIMSPTAWIALEPASITRPGRRRIPRRRPVS